MIREGIILDMSRYEIARECTYDDTIVEGMFVKVDGKDLIPAAYIYPRDKRELIQIQIDKLKAAKKVYDDIQADIFYKQLPAIRSMR